MQSELILDGISMLDMCCGSRMFWFDKQDERVVFIDKRREEHILCDGRPLAITPDLIADFTALPFTDCTFSVVVFDPPHLERVGPKGWQGKKYGKLDRSTWRDELRAGFAEAFRVLRPHGVLIFKWNETQIPVRQIIALTDEKPAIWQRTGKNDKTHWIVFVKGNGKAKPTVSTTAEVWIPCDERMPEEGDVVLVCQEGGIIYCAEMEDGVLYPDEFPRVPTQGREITHWMPLPTAPKVSGS